MTYRLPTSAWHLVAALASLVASGTTNAQHTADVRGIVIDSVSKKPVAGAQVDFFEQAGSGPRVLRAETLTDDEGHFRIRFLTHSSPSLGVRKIGFAPREIMLDDAQLQDTLVIALAPTVTTLGEVHIVEKGGRAQRQLELQGFVQRQKFGIGKFFDSAYVATQTATSLAELLRPFLKGCTMIFVDGVPGRLGDVAVSEVIGIEVYASNTEAPPNFHNSAESTGRCGSVVVWR